MTDRSVKALPNQPHNPNVLSLVETETCRVWGNRHRAWPGLRLSLWEKIGQLQSGHARRKTLRRPVISLPWPIALSNRVVSGRLTGFAAIATRTLLTALGERPNNRRSQRAWS